MLIHRVPLNIVLKVPVFISARVDRWSAAARLLIGASPPVSHTHIDSLSSLLVLQPSCTSRPSASSLSSPLLSPFLFLSVLSIFSPLFFFFFYLVPLASLFIVIFVLSVSPQLSAFLSFSPLPFVASTASFVFLHVDQ